MSNYNRNTVVKIMQGWVGKKESDGSHKSIIDIYNTQKSLPRSYKVKYTDAWCATTYTAAFVKAGYTDICPCECSCNEMIEKAIKMGIWKESDKYVPSPGDAVLYDWQDGTNYASTDNKGSAEHVGMVEKVSGTAITVIEGNKSNAVGRRTLQVNGRYIRGYVVPKFTAGTAANTTEQKAAATSTAKPETIWNFLKEWLGNEYGAAGLMGNLYAESGLIANNLQNSGNTKLGVTDALYTANVDDGDYKKFESDSIGYGIAQWTYSTRKKALKEYADAQKASIGNLNMQLKFLKKEMTESYAAVVKVLKNAKSVKEASNAILTKYERPADQGTTVQAKRASYGQTYYNKYKGTGSTTTGSTTPEAPTTDTKPSYTVGKNYTLVVELKVRTGAGTNYTAKKHNQLTVDGAKHDKDGDGALDAGTVVTCQAVKKVGNDIWIKSPSGWMAAYYDGHKYIK